MQFEMEIWNRSNCIYQGFRNMWICFKKLCHAPMSLYLKIHGLILKLQESNGTNYSRWDLYELPTEKQFLEKISMSQYMLTKRK